MPPKHRSRGDIHAVISDDPPPKLIGLGRAGADIKAKNAFDQTPVYVLSMSGILENDFSSLCSKYGCDPQEFFTADAAGYNAIHKIILDPEFSPLAISHQKYRLAIHQFWKLGCDLDLQDNQGKTPLHYAVIRRNDEAVGALLACGSDPNLLDDEGASAFFHFVDRSEKLNLHNSDIAIITHLSNYLRAMQLAGIYVHPVNTKVYERAHSIVRANVLLDKFGVKRLSDKILTGDIEKLATLKFGGTPICLNEILFEKTIVRYPRMTEEKRRAIDQLFRKNIEKLDGFLLPTIGILLLQYRKAVARGDLCEKAVIALNSLAGLVIPVICVDLILSFLENHELSCLIKAADSKV